MTINDNYLIRLSGLSVVQFDEVANDLAQLLIRVDSEQKYCKELQTSRLTHKFENGMYSRTIAMDKETVVVSGVHKEGCINVINKGHVIVVDSNGKHEYKVGDTFTSPAGTQRVVLCLEDTTWTTIHNLDAAGIPREQIPSLQANPSELFDLMTVNRLDDYLLYRNERLTMKE